MTQNYPHQLLFRSPPFLKKYSHHVDVYQTNHAKLFLLLIASILLSCFIVFFCFGYLHSAHDSVIPVYFDPSTGELKQGLNSASPMYLNPQPLNQTDRTLRAMGIVFFSWWLVTVIWMLKLGVNIAQSGRRWQNHKLLTIGYLYIFNWTIVYNLGFLIYELTQVKDIHLKTYLKHLFANDDSFYSFDIKKHWTYHVAIGAFVIMLPLVWFMIFPMVNNGKLIAFGYKTGYGSNWWFFALQFFTEQTNLMCFILLFAFVINPRWKGFNNYDSWINCMAYLVIVSLTYNLIIFPVIASSYKGMPYDLTRTLWLHVIDPIVFLGTGCCLMVYNPAKKISPWGDTLKYGMVVPSVYAIYALSSPFITGVSPYAYLSNTNPALDIDGVAGSGWTFVIFILFMGFFIIFITIWWYLNARMGLKRYGGTVGYWLPNIHLKNEEISMENVIHNPHQASKKDHSYRTFVLKIDANQLQTLSELPNAVVCLFLPEKTIGINQKIIFVNPDNQVVGTAKLVQLITAPKANLWAQIQPYVYLTKNEFDDQYTNSQDATISTIYDFKSCNDNFLLNNKNLDFVKNVSFWDEQN